MGSCDFKGKSCDTHIEKVKKEAPMVGLTFREKVFPTCLSTSDVLPTPVEERGWGDEARKERKKKRRTKEVVEEGEERERG